MQLSKTAVANGQRKTCVSGHVLILAATPFMIVPLIQGFFLRTSAVFPRHLSRKSACMSSIRREHIKCAKVLRSIEILAKVATRSNNC